MAGPSTQHRVGDLAPTGNADDHLTALVDYILGKLQNRTPLLFGKHCCIYRVPERLRRINPRSYMPERFSIGPFHRGKEKLQEMEEYKMFYAHALLTRSTKTFEECVLSIRGIEEQARVCYSEPINLSSDEFVLMMVIDGLFIIEFFRRKAGEVVTSGDDPYLHNVDVVHDLVKLENQIPMLILNCLYKLCTLDEAGSSINILALKFFDTLMPRDAYELERFSNLEGKHLLDLLGQTFAALHIRVDTNNNLWKNIPSVTELKYAGMKFKKGSTENSFVDIKYMGRGRLEVSPITIKFKTDFLLGNLIAFEEYCGGGHGSHITSYSLLMYRLLDSANDVGLLRNQGIITNHVGTDEDVSQFFKNLAHEVDRSKFCYSALCDQVNSYCNSPWPWRVLRISTWQYVFTHWIKPANVITLIGFVPTIYNYIRRFRESKE